MHPNDRQDDEAMRLGNSGRQLAAAPTRRVSGRDSLLAYLVLVLALLLVLRVTQDLGALIGALTQ